MAGFSTSFGARNPNAQGGHGQYGAQTPGTGAGNPATPSAIPGPRRGTSAYRQPNNADSPDVGGGPPPVQSPSVNRDGTIPPPTPPAAPTIPGSGGANRPGYQDIDYWAQQGVGYGQIFDTTTGQLKPGW